MEEAIKILDEINRVTEDRKNTCGKNGTCFGADSAVTLQRKLVCDSLQDQWPVLEKRHLTASMEAGNTTETVTCKA